MLKAGSLALALALAALAPAALADEPAPPAAEEDLAPVGGPFILVDQNGANVTDEEFRGKFMLLTFGYTNCPDICPTTLMTMASAIHLLGARAKALQPIFISLDPARDDAGRLKEYVGSFGPEFVGLGGPEAFVASAAEKYRILWTKSAVGANGGYSIDHTAGIFLMGPDGEFVARYAHDMPAKALAAAIRERLTGAAP